MVTMPIAIAKQFLQRLETDLRLQGELEPAGWLPEDMVKLAEKHGYCFSLSELNAALDTMYGDLVEEELAYVAGGGCKSAAHHLSPGDVSGSSCFFTGRSGN
jgi:predicted ribosomally synthesized peptide with nif11-like leader